MTDIINFIIGDSETFTPTAMVSIIVFILILDSITMMVSSITGGIRK